MKIVAIVQARMGSTRLPGKSMKLCAGKPLVQLCLERLLPSHYIQEVWLATTSNQVDDVLANLANKLNVLCYRGSAEDVLDRYYQTALRAHAEVIVRVTGDCPLIDYAVTDRVIKNFLEENEFYDYISNTLQPSFPDGLDTEVFTLKALKKAWQESSLLSEREHVTPYIWKNKDKFRVKNVANEVDLSGYRWTVDSASDFQLVELIYGAINKTKHYWHMNDILELLKFHQDWVNINKGQIRNEGYFKSLSKD